MAKTTNGNHAEQQARAQLASVRQMVAALGCDYDRLEELRDEREALAEELKDAEHGANDPQLGVLEHDERDAVYQAVAAARAALEEWDGENAQELAELTEAAGDCESEEQARERISEDPLSVEVRSDWHTPGEDAEPSEFCILLCTGGPACRIVGDLDDSKEPTRARIEYQDWGTPWTELIMSHEEVQDVLAYCRCFYFGE